MILKKRYAGRFSLTDTSFHEILYVDLIYPAEVSNTITHNSNPVEAVSNQNKVHPSFQVSEVHNHLILGSIFVTLVWFPIKKEN
jgi:hypothetical protein